MDSWSFSQVSEHYHSQTHLNIHFYRPQRSWGKVIFSQASVILSTGGRCLLLGGAWSGRCLLLGGVCSGGCLVETPRDGYCCGRYASYWNAFLFVFKFRLEPPLPLHIHFKGGEANLLFGQIFGEDCMKMKEIGPRWGGGECISKCHEAETIGILKFISLLYLQHYDICDSERHKKWCEKMKWSES